MKIYSLASVLILSAITPISIANETAENNSGVSSQVCLGYSNTEDRSGQNIDTAAIGGHLGYVSPVWKGISVGATGYTTHEIGSFDDDALFLSSQGKGYSIAAELWLQAEFANTAIKFGRQAIDTPFADSDDIGIIPNTFEAVVITNNSLANTTITAMHLNKAAGVDAAVPEKFTHLTDTGDAVNALGIAYDTDKWNTQLWQYDQDNQTGNATDITYLEAGMSPIENLDLGVQYTTQEYAAGGKGKAWGATAVYTLADFAFSADYNKVSGANGVQGAVGGVGGGPFFTSAEQNTLDDVANISAKAIGVEYSGFKDLTLAVRKISFDQGVTDELDVTASYQIRDNLSADLIYSDMDTEGKNTRFFVNYDFDI